MDHDPKPFTLDRRPRFPERVTVDVPRGWPARLRLAAERQGTSVNALARAALAPLADPLAADLAALERLPADEREQHLDVRAIKHGEAIRTHLRERAIEQAENVVRLEPKAGA